MAADELVYDATNEIIVIGATKGNAHWRKTLVHQLATDEFLVPGHAPIWQALRRACDEGLEPTVEVMRRLISDAGGDDKAVEHYQAIEAKIPENLDWHIKTMRWDATRARSMTGVVPELIKSIKDATAVQGDVLSQARSLVRALEGSGRRHMGRPAETYRSYQAELAARRANRNVYPLGHEAFDKNLTEGFMPRRTTVTAGLPGSGKSTTWIAIAIMLAKLGRRPMYCAWEMDTESLLDVGCSHMTGVPLVKIVQGTLDDDEAQRVDRASRWILSRIKFMGNPFHDEAKKGKKPSNERNLDLLEGYLAEAACDVVVYDLWERMLPWRKPEDVTGALYRMQNIHDEYNLHGVIVQQLTLKDVEKRADKRPTREAIKGTGAYVEVADLIFGIHREAQFKNVEDSGIETICLKQRKGKPNWSVRWEWRGESCFVGNPKEVSYDPGLENQADGGDFAQTEPGAIKSTPKQPRHKIGRREQ